jgi:hypothetical protein
MSIDAKIDHRIAGRRSNYERTPHHDCAAEFVGVNGE